MIISDCYWTLTKRLMGRRLSKRVQMAGLLLPLVLEFPYIK